MKRLAPKALVLSALLTLWSAVPAFAQFGHAPITSSATLSPVFCNQRSIDLRPIPLGVSGSNLEAIGQGFCCSGTLGSLVQDGAGSQYVLSNNHVIARNNLARAGELVVQPGLADSACIQNSGNAVATLSQFVPILFGGPRNRVDAALAAVDAGQVDAGGAIANIGPISGAIDSSPLGASVQKMGRTTCLTGGKVTAVSVTIAVKYPKICNEGAGTATFTNQIMITPSTFSAAGDSGSLVVTTESCPRAVGMIFAGSSTATFVNPIAEVLSSLNVSMVGTCGLTLPTPTPTPIPGAVSLPGIGGTWIGHVSDVKARHETALLALPGVVGAGIGLSERSGKPALEVYVQRDTPAMRAALPARLEGTRVRIKEIGEVVAY